MASPEPAKVDGASDAEKAVEELKIDNGHKAEKSARYIQGWLLAVNITALLTSMFLVSLDLTIVSTAIPRITHQFHSLNQVGWYGSAFFLTMTVFQATWGKVYKFFPLKTSFLVAIFVFEMGTLTCAVSRNSATLISGRAIAGAGGAGVLSGTYIILAHIVPPEKTPLYIGLTGVVFTLASVAGPLVGGAFTDRITWRWCFYINIPIGGATIGVLAAFLRIPAAPEPVKDSWREILLQMDLPGIIIITSSLICYLLALQLGGISMPWSASTVVGLLVGWILLGLLFIVIEYLQKERAILAPRFLKERLILGCCIYIFFLNAANYIRVYYMPIYFQAIDSVSPEESGIRFLPLIVATSIFTLVSGALLGKVGYYQLFLVLGGILITIGSGLIYTLDIGSSTGKYIGYQILVGIGDGLAVQVPVTACQALSKPVDIPAVTATVLFFQQISGTLGVSAGESIFVNRLLASLPHYAPGISKDLVLNVGASELRQALNPEQIPGILRAYLVGLRGAWVACIVLCGLAFSFSLVVPRISIRGKRVEED